jgi:hypothetical protein
MKKLGMSLLIAAGTLLMTVTAFAGNQDSQGHGRAVVTILPANSNQWPMHVNPQNVKVTVAGKQAQVTGWKPLTGAQAPATQLVLLIDGSAERNLGTQMGDIRNFVKEMPAHTTMTIGYMEYGRAALTGPLSSNPAEVLHGLHIPSNFAYGSASPYLCLSDLAKHWPSHNRAARRVVLMITNGVDEYDVAYNPEDPYVQAAIRDSVRARVAVYTLYWRDRGFAGTGSYQSYDGQNLLSQVAQATGGVNFWNGSGNPVSFQPYFHELRKDLDNQYEVTFAAPHQGKSAMEHLHLQLAGVSAKVTAPEEVYVRSTGSNG